MYIEIILLVGFAMVITLLLDLIPKDRAFIDIWSLFVVVFVLFTVLTLAIYFVTDWLL